MKKGFLLLLVVLLSSFFAGCGGNNGSSPNPPQPPQPPSTITSVTVSPPSVTLEVGKTQQFTVEVKGTGNFDASVNLYVNDVMSGNSTIGTIDISSLYATPNVVPDPATVTVKAVSRQDPTKFGTASVTIVPIQQVSLEWVRFVNFCDNCLRDDGYTVAIDSQDNIIAGGWKWLQNWGNPVPDWIGALVSFDKLGNERWRTDFGATLSWIASIARQPGQDSFYFTGSDGSPSGELNVALLGKIDTDGQILINPFLKSFQINGEETGCSLIRTQESQLYLSCGTGSGRLWMTVADFDSNVQRSFQVRDSGILYGLWVTPNYILTSGQFYDTEGPWSVAGYLRKFDHQGNLLWEGEKTFNDVIQLKVVEDSQGFIYAAGTQLELTPNEPRRYILVKLNQQGEEIWRRFWDGDNPSEQNYCNWVNDLILKPQGGVVVIGALTEFKGASPCCTTYPNCWDFGAWAVDPEGNTLWKIRQDINQSPWDYPRAGAFDSQGRLILVGMTAPKPTGSDFTDNVDLTVVKFRVP